MSKTENNLEIIKVDFDTQTVSARDLYDEVNNGKERFSKWFDRQLQYGFVDGEDYISGVYRKVQSNQYGGEKEVDDYDLSIDMAKQICMVQKTDKARNIRQQLINLEKAWNTPEQVMARALKLADRTINELKTTIEEQKPLVAFANKVSDSSNLIDMGKMAKLLKDEHINIGRNRLFEWLRSNKLLMPNNMPYQRYIESGIFQVKESTYDTPYGTKTQQTTFVTGKGQIYITEKLRKEFEAA